MKRVVNNILMIIAVLVSVYIMGLVLDYIVTDDVDDEYRIYMHDFYNQDKIDTLFLGSSHVFCGVNPAILEEEWNQRVYLGATGAQKPDVAYYLLNEAVKNYDIKTVYLDMFYTQYHDEPRKRTDGQMPFIYCVSDYMKPSVDRLRFVLEASPIENVVRGLFPVINYSHDVFDLEQIDKVVKSKKSEEYLNPTPKGYKGYTGGEISDDIEIGDQFFVDVSSDIDWDYYSDYSLKMINRIATLCKKNDIELILFTVPVSDYTINAKVDYDSFYMETCNIANELGVEYYDFNMLSPECAHMKGGMFLRDNHHLNAHGAYEFSDFFAAMMKERMEGKDISQYFLSSIEEKNAITYELFGRQVLGVLVNNVWADRDKTEINPIEEMEFIPITNDAGADESEFSIEAVLEEKQLSITCTDFKSGREYRQSVEW